MSEQQGGNYDVGGPGPIVVGGTCMPQIKIYIQKFLLSGEGGAKESSFY